MKTIEAKAVVLGAQAVGKTSVVRRCVEDTFDKDVGSTIGAAFSSYKLNVDGCNIHLQIWDTAGQERFKSMTPMYYRKASVAILVYDITDLKSFLSLKAWVQELIRNVEHRIYMILFGNKCDLASKRAVSLEVAAEYAQSIGAEHIEMSALSSQGVSEGFQEVAKMLLSEKNDAHVHIYDDNGIITPKVNRSISIADSDSSFVKEYDDSKGHCGC